MEAEHSKREKTVLDRKLPQSELTARKCKRYVTTTHRFSCVSVKLVGEAGALDVIVVEGTVIRRHRPAARWRHSDVIAVFAARSEALAITLVPRDVGAERTEQAADAIHRTAVK